MGGAPPHTLPDLAHEVLDGSLLGRVQTPAVQLGHGGQRGGEAGDLEQEVTPRLVRQFGQDRQRQKEREKLRDISINHYYV